MQFKRNQYYSFLCPVLFILLVSRTHQAPPEEDNVDGGDAKEQHQQLVYDEGEGHAVVVETCTSSIAAEAALCSIM